MSLNPRAKLGVYAVITALLGLLLGAIAYAYLQQAQERERPDIPGLLWPHPKSLAPFTLIDQHGDGFTLDALQGKWTFLFFGYTHCPDVCPVSLHVLDRVAELLQGSGDDLTGTQFVFVSVDPERDTREKLLTYVGYFNEGFLGVTGNEDKLAALTKQLGVLYLRSGGDEEGGYLIDHTASIFLTDPGGRLIALFGMPHDAKVIAERFQSIRAFVEG